MPKKKICIIVPGVVGSLRVLCLPPTVQKQAFGASVDSSKLSLVNVCVSGNGPHPGCTPPLTGDSLGRLQHHQPPHGPARIKGRDDGRGAK